MGIVERVHRVFRDGLRAYLDNMTKIREWDLILFGLMSAMNNSYKKKLGCTPFYAERGRNMVTMWELEDGELETQVNYSAHLTSIMINTYKAIKMGIAREGAKSKNAYDEKQHGIQFIPGEEVALFCPNVGKTRRQWRAGYFVVKMLTDVNVLIKHERSGKESEVHVKRLARVTWGKKYEEGKEYKGKEPEEWRERY
jgi:hypothetical protein